MDRKELLCRTTRGKYFIASASVLETVISRGRYNENETKTKYHTKKAPKISIEGFLKIMIRRTKWNSIIFVIALILVDRIVVSTNISLNKHNAYRLTLIALLTAAKLYDDFTYTNKFIGEIIGITSYDINDMELQFLQDLDWDLSLLPNEIEMYIDILKRSKHWNN